MVLAWPVNLCNYHVEIFSGLLNAIMARNYSTSLLAGLLFKFPHSTCTGFVCDYIVHCQDLPCCSALHGLQHLMSLVAFLILLELKLRLVTLLHALNSQCHDQMQAAVAGLSQEQLAILNTAIQQTTNTA